MNWYVVVSQKEARIFIRSPERRSLVLIDSIKNPLGKVKRRALVHKPAGRGVKTLGRTGVVSYSQTKRHDPHEEASKQFAKSISKYLRAQKLKKKFDALTVVVEPRFLGKLRTEMSESLLRSVKLWIRKDFQKTPKRQIVDALLPKAKKSSYENPRRTPVT